MAQCLVALAAYARGPALGSPAWIYQTRCGLTRCVTRGEQEDCWALLPGSIALGSLRDTGGLSRT